METVIISQSVAIAASCTQVYELLMTASKHADLTSDEAIIEDKVGSDFSFFSGYITGTNVELVKDRLIVQKWKAQEDAWPNNHFSKVRFELIETKTSTRINFTHEDLPAAVADSIAKGWYDYYWQPMVQYFAAAK